jgi:UDP-N-acetylglucosamine--N-acetylmuramyl-(pentapeptide) pyrophosphoryl-undecaprenol N-acetylglucosamine transferase
VRFIFGAGGTGGHIIPALAIALELSEEKHDIAFIGNKNGMEEGIITRNGFTFLPIKVQKIYRKITFGHIRFPFLFIYSVLRSMLYIFKFKPDAILCTGGFVSGPVALAAILTGRMLFSQDGNSFPGLTTRIISKRAKAVFIASDAARKYLKNAHCILTGNPILKFQTIDKEGINYSALNLRKDTKKLFVIGGSQGSVIINKAISNCLETLLASGVDVIWQTGKSHYENIQAKYGNISGVHCFGFTDKMSEYYQMADLATSRAGALSIAELTEYRIPTVFIPLPTSAENHQLKNAIAQENLGTGLVLEQKNLNSDTLMNSIIKIISDYSQYFEHFSKLKANNAAAEICKILKDNVREKRGK